MNIFDECKMALNNQLSIVSKTEENEILDKMYKYPFKFGNIDFKSAKVKSISLDVLIERTVSHMYSEDVFVITDIEGVPIFKTNIFLIFDNFDEVSALSVKVFILNEKYLAQITSSNELLKIVELNKNS